MRARCAPAVALLIGLITPGLAAAQSLGTISGVVLSAITKAPLAGSKVVLSSAEGAPINTAVADRRGQFVFDRLGPGRYYVSAARTYFATGRYGQKAWNQVGRPIELGAGAAFTAEILLHRLPVITGRVVDENGEGIPNFPVNAITANPKGLTGRVSSAGMTDDRGFFRIAGLKPGRYYVASAPKQLEDGAGLLPTYFPGHVNRSESRPMTVEIDQEAGDVQIQPIPGKLLRLAGMVPLAARYPEARATVTLFREEESRETSADTLGRFAFSDLVPGRYTLVAEMMTPDGARLAAYRPLALYSDLEGITAELVRCPELHVRLVDDNGAEVNDPQVVIFLSRIENGARTQPVRVEPERTPGAYFAGGLMPGEWRFFVICPESYVVESISLRDKDDLGGFLLMPGQKASATIRLARRAGLVRGRVLDGAGGAAPGVPVLCYPLDPQNRNRLGGYRSQKTSPLGEYRFGGLPEGDYLIFATSVEDFNPDERLEELQSRVPAVKITHSSELTRDLRVLE